MLRLILGRAGTGKTASVMEEIRHAVEERRGGQILLVPEQYSHEAERELCSVCPDSLSLYGEVLSFTGLARRIQDELGREPGVSLDRGGRLLCMSLALANSAQRLHVFRAARSRGELQTALLEQLDELKTACVSAEKLEKAADAAEGTLGDKLRDLSLIAAAYEAVVANGRADPADRLDRLAEQIPRCSLGPDSSVYVDGFLDFTAQEQQVLSALLEKGVTLTVCLTVDDLNGNSEIFTLSRISARRLLARAEKLGVGTQIRYTAAGEERQNGLRWFSEELFSYGRAEYPGKDRPVSLLLAESITAECEQVAARILSLVRDGGCRWRDVAVAVRGFEDYRGAIESVFALYGIPLFTARRGELLSKPLPALISLAYEIPESGWEVDDVLSLLRTGLTGLSMEESDCLSDYVYKWQLREGAWERPEDWRQHPDGYGAAYDEAAEARLKRINRLRRRFAAPLLRFAERTEGTPAARSHAAALADLLRDWRLPEQLQARAEALEAADRRELAAEYSQLWEILVSALEQCAAILGAVQMDRASFGGLFTRMLSQYDIGRIPVALDRVGAGDFDRMRRRHIRHLFVLGCSDDRIPRAEQPAGMFDYSERERLLDLDIDLGAGEGELWREFSLLYSTLTLPSESLTLSCPVSGPDGETLRPAFLFNRARAVFSLDPLRPLSEFARLSAPAPALTLAAQSFRCGGSPAVDAAAAWFYRHQPQRMEKLRAAAEMSRGSLSSGSVEALYGKRLRLSASRVDRFASCRYAYFCQYGLRARPYEPIGFSLPEIGSFLHGVLEQVARTVRERGGFRMVSDEDLHRITDGAVEDFIHGQLNDLREKSPRFIHLFRRLCTDADRIVLDMAQELRRSDFEPLDFELDFSRAEEFRPVELGEGEAAMTLTGVADRVDGWLHEGKLYLRVVDYKTGKKAFSLSDVLNGMGMQLLLYLFALEEDGQERYGRQIVPAGVMYLPARSPYVSLSKDSPGEAEKARAAALRRSGLVLDDPALLEAWENGEEKRYIPVKFSKGTAADGVASRERLGLLARHIRGTLTEMAEELRRGSIAADPYYRSQQENACLNCAYSAACRFSEGENGEQSRFLQRLPDGKVWEKMAGRWGAAASPEGEEEPLD